MTEEIFLKLYDKYIDELSHFPYLKKMTKEEYFILLKKELKDCLLLSCDDNFVFYYKTLNNKIEINLCGYYFNDFSFVYNHFINEDILIHIFHHDINTINAIFNKSLISTSGIKKYDKANDKYKHIDDDNYLMSFNLSNDYVVNECGDDGICDIIWTKDQSIIDKFDIYEDVFEVKHV